MTERKPAILVARAIFPSVLERLRQHFDVTSNDEDATWGPDELVSRLQGKVGILTTGAERVGAELLAACPDLRIAANMAVVSVKTSGVLVACTPRSVMAGKSKLL